ncbi:MAG: hypothetical protein V4739_04690 [Pseudomonadota bacterium]
MHREHEILPTPTQLEQARERRQALTAAAQAQHDKHAEERERLHAKELAHHRQLGFRAGYNQAWQRGSLQPMLFGMVVGGVIVALLGALQR